MARIKYYNKQTGQWEYADNVLISGSTSAVEYVEQKLTEEQKEQARENIGAISAIAKDNIDMNGFKITNLPLPTTGSEPATKEFVENFAVEGSTYVATDDNKDGNIVLRPYVADADELEFRNHIKNNNNPHSVTPTQIGAAPMSYAKKVGNPHNLLDNSDFRNPVNQRGQATYTEAGYTFDRWRTWDNGNVTVNDGYIFHDTPLYQYIGEKYDPTKKYTFAVKNTNGNIYTCTGYLNEETYSNGLNISPNNGNPYVRIWVENRVKNLVWAVLYEGEYTAENLPEYQPKGYAAELAECQRYFVRTDSIGMGYAHAYDGSGAYGFIPLPTKMRVEQPTITYNTMNIGTGAYGESFASVTGIQQVYSRGNGVTFWISASGLTGGKVYLLSANNLQISADL